MNENVKYATFSENHYIDYKNNNSYTGGIITCECGGKKCKTLDEFYGLISAYMNN